MHIERSRTVNGCDLGVILKEGALAAVAMKFSTAEGGEVRAVWEHALLEKLCQAMFNQACDRFYGHPHQDLSSVLDATERSIAHPTLDVNDLSYPLESSRVHALQLQPGIEQLLIHLTFSDGTHCSLMLDSAFCLILVFKIMKAIGDFVGPAWPMFQPGADA